MSVAEWTTKGTWRGRGSEAEIEREALPKPKAQHAKVHFTARREVFLKRRQQGQQLFPKDAADETPAQFRSSKDPFKDQWVFAREVDAAVQAVKPVSNLGTQTPYYRRVNVAIQEQPSVVDARVEAGQEAPAMDPRMKKLFDRVLPRMMHHLTQNNEVPIFGDDYTQLTEDDTFVGSRDETYLKEMGNHFHHYTRDQHITALDWRPGKSTIAVSVMTPQSMGERYEALKHVESAVCLIWSFADQQSLQFILEAPAEVLTVKFCPTKPHIVVGGLINGQIAVWNIDVATTGEQRNTKQTRMRPQQHSQDVGEIPEFHPPIPGQIPEQSGDHTVWRLLPILTSKVEYSHRRAVHDICWLPADCECGFDGRLTAAKEGQNQFATVGEDGQMFIWDLRPSNQPEQKMKRLKSSKIAGDHQTWVPLLKWQLSRPDGSGDLIGLRLHVECKNEEGEPIYEMQCTTAEGELAYCYWGPKDERQANQGGFDDVGRREAKVVRGIAQAHAGPGWALQRHPLLPEYYLTVGDWGFKVWKVGLSSPILASPLGEQEVTCGRWSPTRPAVLFIGTKDGSVQVWDLLDRSHEAVYSSMVIQEAITSLELKPVGAHKGAMSSQHLAIGSKRGVFQLFELPKKLVKAHPSEKRLTQQFFEREARRVAYFQWRWKERSREMDTVRQDPADAQKRADDGDMDEDGEYAAGDDEEFFALVEQLAGDDEAASTA